MTKTKVMICIITFSFIPIALGFADTLFKTPRQDRTQTSTQGGMFYLCGNELSIKKLSSIKLSWMFKLITRISGEYEIRKFGNNCSEGGDKLDNQTLCPN